MRDIRTACIFSTVLLCVVDLAAWAKPHTDSSGHKSAIESVKKVDKTGIDAMVQHPDTGNARSISLLFPHQSEPIIPSVINIPSGCFQMGSPEYELGRGVDEVMHRMCVKGFKLAKNEVTVEEFSRFVEATHFVTDAENNNLESGCWSYQNDPDKPWDWRSWANWKQPVEGSALLKNYPATCVSYNDVMAYIEWLNKVTGQEYRLPTEVEWEYAARAGTTTAHYWGNNSDIACGYANVADTSVSGVYKWPVTHSCEDGHFYAAAVKSFPANSFHLHDMLGNAWEWVCSKYEEKYNGSEETCIGPKPDNEVLISIRGGGWNADAARVRAAHRNWAVAWSRQANLGFRLVRVR